MDGFLNKLKSLDAYPKVNEDFFQRTLSGGVITIASSLDYGCAVPLRAQCAALTWGSAW